MAPKRSRVTTPEEEVEDVMPSSRQVANGDGMEDLDNEDLQAEEGEDDGGGSEDEDGPTRKRTRLSEAGAGIDVEPKVEPGTQMKSRITLPRDPSDGFIPGSIVGIRLHNFLTYDDVDFRCGPHLNMLIGANGTGKSSIAGAIAIGLGGTPNVLGRQSEIQGFVKNGKKDGFVEIELKGPTGEPNLVIKLKIKLAELNVQVTNLCAFLPQDKVSEFANMTPQKLLQETQRAAGDPNLTQWHETLIENSKELKLAREILDSDKRELQHLESQNAAQEAQVERYKQRRKLERQVELLSLLLPFAQYAESKLQYDELKKKRESAKRMLEEANAKIEPIQRKKEEFAAHVRAANSVSRKAADKPLAVADKIKKKHGEQAEAEKESEAVLAQREEIKNRAKARKDRIRSLKKEIEKLERTVANEPDVGDTAELNEQRSNLQHEHRLKTEEYRLLQDEQRRIATEISVRKDRVAEAQRGLQSLNDIASQRMHRLRQADQDAADVATWLSKNQNMFKEEIIMPPMLSVFVKDTKYQAQIESLFNINNLKTFICQNEDDYRKMNKSVNDDGIIGRKVRVNIWWRPLSDSQPPVPQENLLSKEEVHLLQGKLLTSSRSQYGRRLAQTATRKITGARLFTGSQVDTERQRELEQIIVNARAEMDAEEAKMGELTDKINGIKEQINKINAAKKQHEFTKVKLSNRRKELKEEESKPEPKEEEEKLKKKCLSLQLSVLESCTRPWLCLISCMKLKWKRRALLYDNQQAVANANAVESYCRLMSKSRRRVPTRQSYSKRLLETTKAKITQVSIRRAGEIHVRDAGDDYANWAIDILVKFRETEKLQILDAHRQSGGERSLSTIMYLLSLTEYARVPFSLVDEINQGMDASAERDVHNQLVEVTCNTDCGQYFLITPKLLTGLHYHEKMKVLCVNNGDWMMHPEPPVPNAGNLMKLVENYANRAVTASA
ncbi:chromosome segregation protein sudA [Rhizoctonia solani]|uniref:Structural maintenance of chromosomes protein 5 n=1 Tax=Rhizoctonia solani TaxID=456999 RepID=A0A8H8NNR1_9AGAM|nr:chromosome segregation protein sudA [Rhizoctonia solani]QRW16550.1 chromosome segregation protein sudA [Rhizoctonia solani]